MLIIDKTGIGVLTIESYVSDVKRFIAFLEANVMKGSVTINRYLFNRFKEHLQECNQFVATINKGHKFIKGI